LNVAPLGDSDGVQTGTGRYQTDSEGLAADIGKQPLISDYNPISIIVNIFLHFYAGFRQNTAFRQVGLTTGKGLFTLKNSRFCCEKQKTAR
jgi:hypothetical protein